MNLGSTMLSINYNYIIPDCIDSSLPTSARLVVSRIFRIFSLAERHPALAHAVMAPLICWSFSNSMFRYPIQGKMLIAISEPRRPRRNSVRYPVNAGLNHVASKHE